MKKAELLAPAGNYESFLGAIHAGADAVYLGGSKFGARAYADNFSEEEIVRAIRFAHVLGRKIYLTVNTLVKENEFSEVFDYLEPFYMAGLDGVIVQDMGVFAAVGRWFPGLERHISTQMTVTGSYGAAYLKKMGAVRIVPARELSLEEIRKIKNEVDIEIETFVHGAVCYCYSGQCLFSSLLGGRSGNRGRCAQPCRLPYEVRADIKSTQKEDRYTKTKEQYPLSLKDMCTIELIPELIEAGIDSFKIEGRMKSPEYVAGVTVLYRKYMDQYYNNPRAEYHVTKQDMKQLQSLYIRSEISEGYYHKYNGKDMITLDNPSYAGRDEILTGQIREDYLSGDYRIPAVGSVCLVKNQPAQLEVTSGGITAEICGSIVEPALKQPLTADSVEKQLRKSGNTFFSFTDIKINMEPDVFMPVKALNELRRAACDLLERQLIKKYSLYYLDRKAVKDEHNTAAITDKEKVSLPENEITLHALAQSREQLETLCSRTIRRIYINYELLIEMEKEPDFWKNHIKGIEFYIALPYVVRKRTGNFFNKLKQLFELGYFKGVLVRNQEELGWLKEINYPGEIVLDANMYIWNREAFAVYEKESTERYIPHELNYPEIVRLMSVCKSGLSQVVYGRIPMMITANCAAQTTGECRNKNSNRQNNYLKLIDRYKKEFPVYLNCSHCYNVIYNSVPLSLHHSIAKLYNLGIFILRMDFTTETGNEVNDIISFFEKVISQNGKNKEQAPFLEYTNGHFKRGVE